MASNGTSTLRLSPDRPPRPPRAERAAAREDPYVPRPRGVGEMLDLAVALFVRDFGAYVAVGLVLLLPIQFLNDALLSRLSEGLGGSGGSLGVAVALTLLPMYAVQGFLSVFVARHAGAAVLGSPATLGSSIRTTLSLSGGFLVCLVAIGLASLGGVCACFFPVFLVLWLLDPAFCVLALERDLAPAPHDPAHRGLLGIGEGFRALRRSPRVVSGFPSFLRWVGTAGASYLLVLPLVTAADPPLAVRETFEARFPAPLLVVTTVSSLLLAIAVGFRNVVASVYYLDQRVRKEGLDLWVALEASRRRAAARGEGVA